MFESRKQKTNIQRYCRTKTSWADDVDELGEYLNLPYEPNAPCSNCNPTLDQQKIETVDENGIRTVVEYSVNDAGKKVKVRRVHLFYRCDRDLTHLSRLLASSRERYKSLL